MVLGKLDNYMQKNQTGLLSHTMHKNKLQTDKDLNVRPKTIKLLVENIGSMLFKFDISNTYFGRI